LTKVNQTHETWSLEQTYDWRLSPRQRSALKRYLAEFDFRYNNRMSLGFFDGERTANALKGIEGKRLTYQPTH
jgi:hypothetical protein